MKKSLLKRVGTPFIAILVLLILGVVYIYVTSASRFNQAKPIAATSDDVFSMHCKTGAGSTDKEQDCYAVCKPLEAGVNAHLAIPPVDLIKDGAPPGLSLLVDICLPFFELPEYQILDRTTGTISPQDLSGFAQLYAGISYGQVTCPPLIVTPYRDVLPLLDSNLAIGDEGLALKDYIPETMQDLTFAAGPINENPETAPVQICTFIKEHNIDVNEVKQLISSFETMNDFFAREIELDKLRPTNPDPLALVSPADSTLVVYPTIAEAQTFWIKGESFTLGQFLDEDNADFVERYPNPSIALFRLSVNDYHRFHAPLAGDVLNIHWVNTADDFFSVQPIALHNPDISVLSENRRVILEIENDLIGSYLMIPVGATQVGSIILEEDVPAFAKGDEVGRFEFGGSLVALIFQESAMSFDEDLLEASRQTVEARVLVGEQVGQITNATNK